MATKIGEDVAIKDPDVVRDKISKVTEKFFAGLGDGGENFNYLGDYFRQRKEYILAQLPGSEGTNIEILLTVLKGLIDVLGDVESLAQDEELQKKIKAVYDAIESEDFDEIRDATVEFFKFTDEWIVTNRLGKGNGLADDVGEMFSTDGKGGIFEKVNSDEEEADEVNVVEAKFDLFHGCSVNCEHVIDGDGNEAQSSLSESGAVDIEVNKEISFTVESDTEVEVECAGVEFVKDDNKYTSEEPISTDIEIKVKEAAKKKVVRKRIVRKKTTAAEATAAKVPATEATAEEAPAEKTTAAEATAEKTTATEVPAAEATAVEVPEAEATAVEVPEAEATAVEAPAAKATAKKKHLAKVDDHDEPSEQTIPQADINFESPNASSENAGEKIVPVDEQSFARNSIKFVCYGDVLDKRFNISKVKVTQKGKGSLVRKEELLVTDNGYVKVPFEVVDFSVGTIDMIEFFISKRAPGSAYSVDPGTISGINKKNTASCVVSNKGGDLYKVMATEVRVEDGLVVLNIPLKKAVYAIRLSDHGEVRVNAKDYSKRKSQKCGVENVGGEKVYIKIEGDGDTGQYFTFSIEGGADIDPAQTKPIILEPKNIRIFPETQKLIVFVKFFSDASFENRVGEEILFIVNEGIPNRLDFKNKKISEPMRNFSKCVIQQIEKLKSAKTVYDFFSLAQECYEDAMKIDGIDQIIDKKKTERNWKNIIVLIENTKYICKELWKYDKRKMGKVLIKIFSSPWINKKPLEMLVFDNMVMGEKPSIYATRECYKKIMFLFSKVFVLVKGLNKADMRFFLLVIAEVVQVCEGGYIRLVVSVRTLSLLEADSTRLGTKKLQNLMWKIASTVKVVEITDPAAKAEIDKNVAKSFKKSFSEKVAKVDDKWTSPIDNFRASKVDNFTSSTNGSSFIDCIKESRDQSIVARKIDKVSVIIIKIADCVIKIFVIVYRFVKLADNKILKTEHPESVLFILILQGILIGGGRPNEWNGDSELSKKIIHYIRLFQKNTIFRKSDKNKWLAQDGLEKAKTFNSAVMEVLPEKKANNFLSKIRGCKNVLEVCDESAKLTNRKDEKKELSSLKSLFVELLQLCQDVDSSATNSPVTHVFLLSVAEMLNKGGLAGAASALLEKIGSEAPLSPPAVRKRRSGVNSRAVYEKTPEAPNDSGRRKRSRRDKGRTKSS